MPLGEALPVGVAQPGPAVIRTNVRGDAVEEFEIQIEKVLPQAADGRDLVLTVTDPELIALTGGIVQGMWLSYNWDNTGKTLAAFFELRI